MFRNFCKYNKNSKYLEFSFKKYWKDFLGRDDFFHLSQCFYEVRAIKTPIPLG